MLSVQEARNEISKYSVNNRIVNLSLDVALNYTIAKTVYSPVDLPHFNQSAMDGYAFKFEEWDGISDLPVVGEILAGNNYSGILEKGNSVRIFTGAAVPHQVDTIVIQENIIREGNHIKIRANKITKGDNIRLQGSQTRKGDLILELGQRLTPPAISFLSGLGIANLEVFANPSVGIITTGKELVKPGMKLEPGKIFESNSFGLKSALMQLGINPSSIETVDDSLDDIMQAINRIIHHDIIILTGGVSVGDYDLVSLALERCGVTRVFHKVKQRPGKPFYFGMVNRTLIFGLPGNPASALTCFYEYVADAIGLFTRKEYFKREQLLLTNGFVKKPGLSYFLKGKKGTTGVSILSDQESFKMNSFAMADCIIELEEDKEIFRPNDPVMVRIIT